ncbi:MAG: hypothetical protein K9N07_01010 [Candidatus Cloacimonetes bacterium]|nr:hypothetical protein [Candidatus Cloacimonadota bacterium]
MKNILLLIIITLIVSCTYSVYTSGYPHLKTITVIPIENYSTNYDLSDIVFTSLIGNFESDGRLKLVGLAPDCQLECIIQDYSNKIATYSGSSVDEYEVRILFSVTFTDLKNNEVIWKNDSLIISERYSKVNENSEFKSESAVQNEIGQKLFDNILKNTLEEW